MMQQAAAAQQQAMAQAQAGGQGGQAGAQAQAAQQQMAAYQQQLAAYAQQQQQQQAQMQQQGGAQASQAAQAQQQAAQAAQVQAQQAAQAAAGQPGAQPPPPPGRTSQYDEAIVVTGCTHGTVGPIIRGNFILAGENHGKPCYKKDTQVNGLDVLTYFWDSRDGEAFSGWWFGPKVGGDQVWAYHADKASVAPPQTGWKVPYDGPVDASMFITPKPKPGQPAAGQQAQMQAQMQAQQMAAMQQRQAQGQQPQPVNPQDQMRLQQQRMQLEQLKIKQQEEQKKRLDENRKKLEEANKARTEGQQQKMAYMKEQQAEFARKRQEEMQKRQEQVLQQRAEQEAVLKIRRVMQKFGFSSQEKYEEYKAEFQAMMDSELDKCGSQTDRIKAECEEAFVKTAKRMEDMEEARKLAEQRKAAELERRRECHAKAKKLIEDLNSLIDTAEESGKGASEEAEPLNGDRDVKAEEIEKAAKAVEVAVEAANAKLKACTDFVIEQQGPIKDTPPIDGEPVPTCAQDLNKCLQRINEIKKMVSSTQQSASINKVKKHKRAEALIELEKQMAIFKKYTKTGTLSRKDIMAYSKGEFGFMISAASLDQIMHVLVEEGAKGVARENFHRVRAAVGLSREVAADAKRREEREEREKAALKAKEDLKGRISEAKEVVDAAEEAVKLAEEQTGPALTTKTAELTEAADMVAAVAEVDAFLTQGKESIAGAKAKIQALNDDVSDELKDFLALEVKMLDQLIKNFENRLSKANAAATKVRVAAVKKAGGKLLKVVKDTIVTSAFSLAGDKDETRKLKDSTRKLKEGEIVEEIEPAAKEEESSLMRMKVRVISDGQIGWATSVGNTGIVFLEAES